MGLAEFKRRLSDAPYGNNDKKWFPRWLRRYAAGKTLLHGKLPVTESSVIEFSKSLRQSGTPAWQRLQGVRAVEAYRNLVLQAAEPNLTDVKRALDRLAAFEKESGAAIGAALDKQAHLGRLPKATMIVGFQPTNSSIPMVNRLHPASDRLRPFAMERATKTASPYFLTAAAQN